MRHENDVGGRPLKEINQDTFEGLCRIQCTKEDICDVVDCDEKTLTAWCKRVYGVGFSEIYKSKSAAGKASLRRMQYKSAEEGSATMQIWLGKQYLGQRDRQEFEHSGGIDITQRTTLIDKYLSTGDAK